MLDYAVVVPSRRRVKNMATITSILPTAIVCVDEREAEDYGQHGGRVMHTLTLTDSEIGTLTFALTWTAAHWRERAGAATDPITKGGSDAEWQQCMSLHKRLWALRTSEPVAA